MLEGSERRRRLYRKVEDMSNVLSHVFLRNKILKLQVYEELRRASEKTKELEQTFRALTQKTTLRIKQGFLA